MNLTDTFPFDSVEPGYSIELSGGSTHRVTFEWEFVDGDLPPLFYAYTEAGRLEFGELTGDNTQQLVFTPEEDDIYYFVTEFSGATAQPPLETQLSFETLADDYADNINTSGLISVAEAIDGIHETAGDSDWFRADLIAGTTYQFVAQSETTILQLTAFSSDEAEFGVDESGERIEMGSLDLLSGNSALTLTPLENSTFYVEVSGIATGENNTDYILSLNTIEDDFSDNLNTTGLLSLETPLQGIINAQDDADLIRMQLDAGKTYQITLDSEDPLAPEPYLEWFSLTDGQGVTALESGDQAVITISPDLSSEYFLRVEDNHSGEGFSAYHYELSLENMSNINAPDHLDVVERVALLFEAALGRKPGEAGLNYFVSDVRGGQTLQQIANSFYLSEEFRNNFESFTDEAYIEQLYHNVLDRAPEQQGLEYWLDQLQAGLSHADILVSFADSAENRSNSADWLDDLVYQADTDMWLLV